MAAQEDQAFAKLDARGKADVQPPSIPKGLKVTMWSIGGVLAVLIGMGVYFGEIYEEDPAVAAAAVQEERVTLGAEADKLFTDYKAFAAPCDEAGDRTNAAIQSASLAPDELYSLAQGAGEVCKQSATSIALKLKPPKGADEALGKKFETALESCSVAYSGKRHSYQSLAKAIDTGLRPAAVAEYKGYVAGTNEALAECVSGMMSAVTEAGGKTGYPSDAPGSEAG